MLVRKDLFIDGKKSLLNFAPGWIYTVKTAYEILNFSKKNVFSIVSPLGMGYKIIGYSMYRIRVQIP